VGIANNQTGIYPIESPGGWQLIGRTPVKLFDPSRENPFLLKAGDLLKFRPISREEYDGLAQGEAA
jgi:allophanate hydrolase subunit 1